MLVADLLAGKKVADDDVANEFLEEAEEAVELTDAEEKLASLPAKVKNLIEEVITGCGTAVVDFGALAALISIQHGGGAFKAGMAAHCMAEDINQHFNKMAGYTAEVVAKKFCTDLGIEYPG